MNAVSEKVAELTVVEGLLSEFKELEILLRDTSNILHSQADRLIGYEPEDAKNPTPELPKDAPLFAHIGQQLRGIRALATHCINGANRLRKIG